MKPTAIISATTTLILFSACASNRKMAPTSPIVAPIHNTSNTNTIHTERIDTVYIRIPAQSAERTTTGNDSHLETDYAESDARINADGTLYHTIKNKPQPKPVPVKATTDATYIDKTIEKPVPVPVPKAVERELTWWEKTRLKTWGWLLAALIAAGAWITRKPILTLARRLITKRP